MLGLELLVLGSALAFILSGTVVGTRMLRLGRRTGGLPERAVGFSMLLLSALAWPLLLLVGSPVALPEPLLRAAFAGASVAMALGWTGVFVFTWHVFRGGDGWARALAAAGIGVELGAGLAAVVRAIVAEEAASLRTPALPSLLLLLGAQGAYAWTAIESFRYRGLLRRRIPLGLADPLVANRMGLWGWTALFAAGSIGPSIVAVMLGSDPHTAGNHLVVAVCGLVCSGTLWLAFLPPAAYVRWVQEAASAEPVETA